MARIANPPEQGKSKRGSVQHLEQDFGVCLSLEKVYRMMDQLDDNAISRLQAMICEGTRSLLPGALYQQPKDLTLCAFHGEFEVIQ